MSKQKVLIPDWSRTPRVVPTDLSEALRILQIFGEGLPNTPDGHYWADLYERSLLARFPDRNTATALWARSRALLSWQAAPEIIESDRLAALALDVEVAAGADVNADAAKRAEYAGRVAAAAVHPLERDGRFTPGFRDAIIAAKEQLLISLAGSTGTN
jgi:hypothetical protein